MIGLPTIVTSRISPRATPASRAASPISASIASRTAARQLRVAARIHHHVGDAAHQVLAEADLRVHRARRGDDLAARRDRRDGRRWWSSRCRRRRRRRARRSPADARRCRGPCAPRRSPSSRPARSVFCRPRERRRDRRVRPARPHCSPSACCRRRKIARRVVHVGLGDLDVVEAHDRIDLDRMRSRRACARPAGGPGSPAARRRRDRRRSCAWQPSRRPAASAPRLSA